MSVLDRARQAASQAADQARHPPRATESGWGTTSAAGSPADVPPATSTGTPVDAPDPGAVAGADAAVPGWGQGQASAPQAMDWNQLGSQMRDVASKAKGGLASVLDKIDPGMLAEVIVRATALQEGANRSLRDRGSAYRVGEITITATIPPQIGFSIQRIGDLDGDGVPDVLEDSAPA